MALAMAFAIRDSTEQPIINGQGVRLFVFGDSGGFADTELSGFADPDMGCAALSW